MTFQTTFSNWLTVFLSQIHCNHHQFYDSVLTKPSTLSPNGQTLEASDNVLIIGSHFHIISYCHNCKHVKAGLTKEKGYKQVQKTFLKNVERCRDGCAKNHRN